MAIDEKLEQWRNKTEREKHTVAVIGSTVLTSLVVIAWGYTFFDDLNHPEEVARNEVYNEQFSPLAPLKNFFSQNLEKIKEGGETVKNTASAMFLASTTTEINQ